MIGLRCLSVACPCTTPVGYLHKAGRARTMDSSTQLDFTDGSHNNQRLYQAYLSTSAKTFPGPYSQSTWMKSNPEHLCQLGSPSRPQHGPYCPTLPGPHWGLLPTTSFLPGSREPCQDGRSVMGAWSMPSLPSAMPLAKRQQQSDTPQTT